MYFLGKHENGLFLNRVNETTTRTVHDLYNDQTQTRFRKHEIFSCAIRVHKLNENEMK